MSGWPVPKANAFVDHSSERPDQLRSGSRAHTRECVATLCAFHASLERTMANKTKSGYKPAKNYEPNRGKAKPGSKSPKHRGYRAEADAPKKARWNADDRAARTGRTDQPRNGRDARPRYDRDSRPTRSVSGDRPDWTPRSDRPVRESRPQHDRVERRTSRYFDERGTERSHQGDRSERPRYDRDARTERPRTDRSDRPRSDRDARPQRGERNGRSRYDRDARPQRNHRDDRPRYDRDQRSEQRFTPQDDVVLERLQAQATTATDVAGMTFGDLGLGSNIVRSLEQLGAASPFPIQAATIPDVLAGKDVLGRGRTGSGKTIAFGAPLVERLLTLSAGHPASDEREEKLVRGERASRKRKHGRNPRALILAPTRELALQIDRTVQPIAQSVGLFTTQIYGGVPQARQVGALQRGVDIIIGTPGRIEDLIEQGRLNLSEVQITVLDEADHMCDLGFLEPVQRILRRTASGGQKLLFSATLDKGVASLVNEFLPSPTVHEVAGEDQASGTIDHRVLMVNREDKLEVIQQLVDRPGKTLVFSRTRAYAERLADELEDAGIPATSLHGDLNQSRRTRNLEKLTKGRVNVLVATDVAARGIHVDDIDLVLQADPPDEYKTYLHRAGRTGRAGKQGMVVTLIPRTKQKKTRELLQRAEINAEATAFYPGDSL